MPKVIHPPADPLSFLQESESLTRLLPLLSTTNAFTDYLHWDQVIHRTPPDGFTHGEWWAALKFARQSSLREVPLHAVGGRSFRYVMTDGLVEKLHRIDQNASGQITIPDLVTNPSTRNRYVMNSLIEEAITSSQIEGASTTRGVAKEMLRTGRAPRDRSERMIYNNFTAMQRVLEVTDQALTPDLIFELHRIVTHDTLENPSAAGRLQPPDEERVAVWEGGERLHMPPPAEELPGRLQALCDFANGGTDDQPFIHPVLRAIIVHFMVGYDHPFEDGNGRTARALFYWSMLSQGYWLAEFLTISAILKKARAKYTRAYLYTETDDNDLTYFINYQLDVICRSITELHAYLGRKVKEVRETERLFKSHGRLNHRQVDLLTHALRNIDDAQYTVRSHQRSHRVVYQTARSDLLALEDLALLERYRVGRTDHFYPYPDLAERLRALPEKPPA